MKKVYSFLTRSILSVATLAGAALMLNSCVNADYDLEKINTDNIVVGEYFALPIGYTNEIYLGDLIDTADVDLLALVDRNYNLTLSDSTEVSISEILGDQDISIDEINYETSINTDFSKPTLDPISLDVDPSTIDVDPGMSGISVDDQKIEYKQEVSLDMGAGNSFGNSGVTVPETSLTHGVGSQTANIAIDDVTCPTQVTKITDFSLASTDAVLKIDVTEFKSALDNASTSTFSLTIPSLTITFPDGYKVNGGDSNVLSKTNLVADADGYVSVNFTFNKTYDEITPSGGKISGLGGDVTIALSDSFTIAGQTTSVTPSKIAVSLDATIKVTNMDITLTAEIEVDDDDDLCGETTINNISSLVTHIGTLTMKTGSDTIGISITSVSLPAGLSVGSEVLKLKFPASKFTLDEDASVSKVSDDYVLSIPVRDVVGGSGFNHTITLNEIIIDQDVADSMPDIDDDGSITFDPGIVLEGATISISGTLSLDDLNTYCNSGDNKEITTAITATGLEIDDAEVTISTYTAPISQQTIDISLSESLGDEIVRVDYLTFADDVYVNLDIEVALTGIDSDLSFYNFEACFPKFIVFDSSVDVDADNKLKLNDIFTEETSSRKFSAQYKIDKLDFTSYQGLIQEGELTLDEVVTLEGAIKLDGGVASSGSLPSSISASVDVSINEMTIKEVSGKLDASYDDTESLDLTEYAEDLEGLDISIKLNNPSVSLEIVNPLDLSFSLTTLSITPYKGGAAQTPVVSESVNVAASSTSKIVLSGNDAPTTAEPGVQYVKLDGLSSLLATVPDSVVINYAAGLDGDSHTIDLTADYDDFKVKYDLNIPLEFDEFKISYTTTVEDLNESIAELTDYVSSLTLNILSTSTLPLTLTISEIKLLDTNGGELTYLDPIVKEGTNSIAANGTSKLQLSIADNKADDLARLDALEISVVAEITSSENGGQLSEDQYIKFKVSAVVPEGITVDMADEE